MEDSCVESENSHEEAARDDSVALICTCAGKAASRTLDAYSTLQEETSLTFETVFGKITGLTVVIASELLTFA